MTGKDLSILLLIFIIPACTSPTETSEENDEPPEAGIPVLEFIASYGLDISDPSGLTIDPSREFLWTVSDDHSDFIYRISFEGEILEVLTGYEGHDMEGITINPNDGTLWVAEERFRQIVQLTTEGEVLQIVNIPVEVINSNDGLEGIAWNPTNNHVYIVNEKNPRIFIELDDEFEVVRSVPVNFSSPYDMSDLSGLFYDEVDDVIWMVSDESEKVVIVDQDLNPFWVFDTGREKMEGIAVDREGGRVYMVNDAEERLYVYKLSYEE